MWLWKTYLPFDSLPKHICMQYDLADCISCWLHFLLTVFLLTAFLVKAADRTTCKKWNYTWCSGAPIFVRLNVRPESKVESAMCSSWARSSSQQGVPVSKEFQSARNSRKSAEMKGLNALVIFSAHTVHCVPASDILICSSVQIASSWSWGTSTSN